MIELNTSKSKFSIYPEKGMQWHNLSFFHSKKKNWIEVLSGWCPSRDFFGSGSFFMFPWVNRLVKPPYKTNKLNLDGNGIPLHGLVFDIPWQILESTNNYLCLSLDWHGEKLFIDRKSKSPDGMGAGLDDSVSNIYQNTIVPDIMGVGTIDPLPSINPNTIIPDSVELGFNKSFNNNNPNKNNSEESKSGSRDGSNIENNNREDLESIQENSFREEPSIDSFKLRTEYLLDESSLSVGLTVKNTGNSPTKYAAGFHPYFRLHGHREFNFMEMPNSEEIQLNKVNLLPEHDGEGHLAIDNFLKNRKFCLNQISLDNLYRQKNGLDVSLMDSSMGYRIRISSLPNSNRSTYNYCQVYTSEDGKSIAIEPMNSFANYLNFPLEGMNTLIPGEIVQFHFQIKFSLEN